MDKAKSAGLEPDYYAILKSSILKYFAFEIVYGSVVCFVSECLSLTYIYIMKDMIKYIKGESDQKDKQDEWYGVRLIASFIGMMAVCQTLKNHQMFHG